MNEYINNLIGLRVIKIHRYLDMLCINFGNTKRKCALHIQSPWKILDSNRRKVVVAYLDEFTELCELKENQRAVTVFDKKISEQQSIIENLQVIACNINCVGDLQINFSNSYILRVFINTSENEECWRLLMDSDEKHYVVKGKEILFE